MPTDPLGALRDQFPGRHPQIDLLATALLDPSHTVPACYVYGLPSTSKTGIVRGMLEAAVDEKRRAFVDLDECSGSPRCLFQRVLDAFSGTAPSAANGYAPFQRCDTLCDFVHYLRELLASEKSAPARIIALDHAEQLNAMGPHLLPALLDLAEIAQRRITVILIAQLPLEKLRLGTGFRAPLEICFSQYTSSEMMDMLVRDAPREAEYADVYAAFARIVHDIFYRPCRDLTEIRHMTALLWPKYVQPLLAGSVKAHEQGRLLRRIEGSLRDALGDLHLRQLSRGEFLRRAMATLTLNVAQQEARRVPPDFELPYLSKWLLIAAYLASYNPARFDTRYFVRASERTARPRRVARAAPAARGAGGAPAVRLRQQLQGPKPFPVDRMLAIFYHLLDQHVDAGAPRGLQTQSQIATLVSLRLLLRTSAADRLDAVKCKCNVSYDYIVKLAQDVRLDVTRYLHDA